MSDYSFRGKPITGAHAYVLLGAIRMVQKEAPNLLPEDIETLQEIVDEFEKKFTHDLREAYKEEDEMGG